MADVLEDADRELLEQNKVEREKIADEIRELKARNESRKKEREEEERRLAGERSAEEQRRKAEEEDRRRKKEEDDVNRRNARASKMAEFEKYKNPPKANFVISKKQSGEGGAEEGDESQDSNKKSKEQLEHEKRAILRQRIKPLEIDGFDSHRLSDKAKELHHQIHRLEGEKYDLEKRYKILQFEMTELAERARQANKVGKDGVKRIATAQEEAVDRIQARFAGAPCKVEMFSKYERQKDKRTYDDRKVLYVGPQFGYPADRIKPQRIVKWGEDGLPVYEEMGAGGGEAHAAPVEA